MSRSRQSCQDVNNDRNLAKCRSRHVSMSSRYSLKQRQQLGERWRAMRQSSWCSRWRIAWYMYQLLAAEAWRLMISSSQLYRLVGRRSDFLQPDAAHLPSIIGQRQSPLDHCHRRYMDSYIIALLYRTPCDDPCYDNAFCLAQCTLNTWDSMTSFLPYRYCITTPCCGYRK